MIAGTACESVSLPTADVLPPQDAASPGREKYQVTHMYIHVHIHIMHTQAMASSL